METNGLPGAILEAMDNDKVFHYQAIRIVKNTNLQLPGNYYTYIQKHKADALDYNIVEANWTKYLKERDAEMLASYPKGTVFKDEKLHIRRAELEKDFEWEIPKTQK